MTLYDELKAAGVELDHHESDLYVKCGAVTDEMVKRHDIRKTARRFNASDGTGLWWDVPFGYQPFWDKVAKRSALAGFLGI